MLKPDALDLQVKTDTPVNIQVLDSNIQIIDQVLQANHESPSLNEHHEQLWNSNNRDGEWKLVDGLLLWRDQLLVPEEKESELQTQLLDEIHAQVSMTHPEKIKILQLVQACFYWPT